MHCHPYISIHVLRVEDDKDWLSIGEAWHISIHVLRVEDDYSHFQQPASKNISIHVLRVEDDCSAILASLASIISIHVLRVEDDFCILILRDVHLVFQSTSSVWRTTLFRIRNAFTAHDFNPRPPCGGRLAVPAFKSLNSLHFNPRPPCGPPCGGRQYLKPPKGYYNGISIHVLRVEDDSKNREKSLFAFI